MKKEGPTEHTERHRRIIFASIFSVYSVCSVGSKNKKGDKNEKK